MYMSPKTFRTSLRRCIFISERELSVCLSSVTFVHRTQAIEISANVSTPFGTMAICDLSVKSLQRSSQGNPSVGGVGLNRRGVAKYSNFFKAISRKRCKIGDKFVLITNRKSYMSFRLVLKSVTLNDLERRNGSYFALFQPIC